jgi:hypothetical protein
MSSAADRQGGDQPWVRGKGDEKVAPEKSDATGCRPGREDKTKPR